jgi:predicted nucleic acid-binding protein
VIFVDTNILLRAVDTSAEHYPIVEKALARLRGYHETLCIAPQNVVEFWSVATRPQDKNGLGMSSSRAAKEITALQALFRLLPYTADVLPTWERIAVTHGVAGKPSHDAHLVALMQVHGVKQLLTFNGADFKRFEVEVIEPAKVV